MCFHIVISLRHILGIPKSDRICAVKIVEINNFDLTLFIELHFNEVTSFVKSLIHLFDTYDNKICMFGVVVFIIFTKTKFARFIIYIINYIIVNMDG